MDRKSKALVELRWLYGTAGVVKDTWPVVAIVAMAFVVKFVSAVVNVAAVPDAAQVPVTPGGDT